jgi:glucuronosyltransferase
VSSYGGNHYLNYAIGNEVSPAYVPNLAFPFTSKMTFFQRAINTATNFVSDVLIDLFYYPKQDALKENFFGPGLPYIKTLVRSTSLVLVNNHFSMTYTRPLLPNFVEVGGMHLYQPTSELSEDVNDWLDGSKDGVIYFSFGSTINPENFPEKSQEALFQAFAEFPQRILMKRNADALPKRICKNVKFAQWFSQREVLGISFIYFIACINIDLLKLIQTSKYSSHMEVF